MNERACDSTSLHAFGLRRDGTVDHIVNAMNKRRKFSREKQILRVSAAILHGFARFQGYFALFSGDFARSCGDFARFCGEISDQDNFPSKNVIFI